MRSVLKRLEVHTERPPAWGLLKRGQVYERSLFTAAEVAALSAFWQIIQGEIAEGPRRGTRVLWFRRRKV